MNAPDWLQRLTPHQQDHVKHYTTTYAPDLDLNDVEAVVARLSVAYCWRCNRIAERLRTEGLLP